MSLARRGQTAAEEFVRHGVETWEAEGRIDSTRAAEVLNKLNAPGAEAAMLHLGAHFAISLPLRFPFGAGARFLYTLSLRIRAEVTSLLHKGSARDARRTHTVLVMLVSLLPGFGRLGYFFCPALREERLLLFIPLDQVSRKLPFRAYSRLHLDALLVYWGLGDESGLRVKDLFSFADAKARFSAISPYMRPTVTLLVVDSVILLIGAYLFLDSGRPTSTLWWWREGGLVATLDAGQLLIGACFGIAAYVTFWKQVRDPSRGEAAGIFLWAIGGIGLAVFAIDDYFTVHERLGEALVDLLSFIPVFTKVPSDMLVLLYAVAGLTVIVAFHAEVLARRPSSILLQFAAVASVLMVLTDGFATSEVMRTLEFPSQTFACTLLMLAFATRWAEVRRAGAANHAFELTDMRGQSCA